MIAILKLCHRLDAKGLTLNGDKCEYNQPSLWFYGYSLSKDGLSADPKKVEAIVKTTTPQNVAQLRRFLGLANYCARFIKDFATLSAPLNELTKKPTKWQWTVVHQKAVLRKLRLQFPRIAAWLSMILPKKQP